MNHVKETSRKCNHSIHMKLIHSDEKPISPQTTRRGRVVKPLKTLNLEFLFCYSVFFSLRK